MTVTCSSYDALTNQIYSLKSPISGNIIATMAGRVLLVAKLYLQAVCPIMKLFCLWAEANFSPIASVLNISVEPLIAGYCPLTPTEKRRIAGVLFEYHDFCLKTYSHRSHEDHRVPLPFVSRRVGCLEMEQLKCIHVFLTDMAGNIAEALGSRYSWDWDKVLLDYPGLAQETTLCKYFSCRKAKDGTTPPMEIVRFLVFVNICSQRHTQLLPGHQNMQKCLYHDMDFPIMA